MNATNTIYIIDEYLKCNSTSLPEYNSTYYATVIFLVFGIFLQQVQELSIILRMVLIPYLLQNYIYGVTLAISIVWTIDLPIVKYHTLVKSENLFLIGIKLKGEFSKLALVSSNNIPVFINYAINTNYITLFMNSLL